MTAYALIVFLGYPGLALAVFAGLLAARGILSIWIVAPLCVIGAVAGDSFGYWTGKKFGRRLFSRPDSFFFRKDFIDRTEAFYSKHGKKTLVLARFIPIIRTFAPIFAGIGEMEYRLFLSFNAAGGLLWGAGLTLSGYFLGIRFPQTERYLFDIVIVIIIASLVPVGFEFFRSRRKKPLPPAGL